MVGGETFGLYASEARPEQILACAVLRQALDDALTLRPERREPARRFQLGQSADFRFWCDLAGLPVNPVRESARLELKCDGPEGLRT